ncbi:DUF4230 domain-containing protein [Flavihumibacter rivuli]|uniref:DUF4230 domain-containing protein n=1 Tax=Flavihumibacter rivuli TaxID=2838156 RepID=UPI001BDE6E43|nr:DUF4230 domain-containing protein [Flavihumibacter rivuli]ULQ58123.1 DUF4230 domain-containing protein [Flavihumibacter rivuli]
MGIFKHYAYALLLMVCACSTPDPKQRVLALREMSELATTEYTVTKIVKANDNRDWYKFGERKILLSTQTIIKAGIDLKGIQPEDITISGKSISLVLPPPRIISFNMPPEKIKVEYEEIGMFRMEFDNTERDALLSQAEKQVRDAIPQMGIYDQTMVNTKNALTGILRQIGYDEVQIRFSKSQPTNPAL